MLQTGNTHDLLYMCHMANVYKTLNCLAIEAGYYSDVVECLPVNSATWIRFLAGTGKIFSLYDT